MLKYILVESTFERGGGPSQLFAVTQRSTGSKPKSTIFPEEKKSLKIAKQCYSFARALTARTIALGLCAAYVSLGLF
jgi:hypothetical protein